MDRHLAAHPVLAGHTLTPCSLHSTVPAPCRGRPCPPAVTSTLLGGSALQGAGSPSLHSALFPTLKNPQVGLSSSCPEPGSSPFLQGQGRLCAHPSSCHSVEGKGSRSGAWDQPGFLQPLGARRLLVRARAAPTYAISSSLCCRAWTGAAVIFLAPVTSPLSPLSAAVTPKHLRSAAEPSTVPAAVRQPQPYPTQ